MAGPGDDVAAAEGRSQGGLRASDADREQVIDALKAAFVQGRLAVEEHDRRAAQASTAWSRAELAALTADLPRRSEGWRLEQPEPGIPAWRTPSGRTYITTPTEYPV